MEIRTTFFYRMWKSFTVKRYGKWQPTDDPKAILSSLECCYEHFDEEVEGTEWLAGLNGERRERVHTFYSPNLKRTQFLNVQVKIVCKPIIETFRSE